MKITLGNLRKCDEQKAIDFAVKGMHFDWFIKDERMLRMFGKYFWYSEIVKATQIISAYADGKFAGVLLAEIKGEPRLENTLKRRLYIRGFKLIQKLHLKGGKNSYIEINERLFKKYCENNVPDGELLFLASDPDSGIKGVGSVLLKELERREKGKKLYLYTDSSCTYQFYDHRSFERSCSEKTVLKFHKSETELMCFLYSKIMGSDS